MNKFDLFAESIPSFHIEGHNKIGTSVGCVLSGLLATLVLGFTCIRGRYLVTGDRPNISSFTAQDERNGHDVVDLSDYQFKVAFSINFLQGDHEIHGADDPDFVEWDAHFYDTQ